MQATVTPQSDMSPAKHVLLITRNSAWRDAVGRASAGLAYVDVIDEPVEAIRKLMAVSSRYSHVLLDMAIGAKWLPVVSGLTVGEAESETALIRLGGSGTDLAQGPTLGELNSETLARAMSATARDPAATLRPLSHLEITGALRDGYIGCRFQPIVRIADSQLTGFEVLARFDHPVRGTLPPSLFVAQMEGTGLSLQLADAVFHSCLSTIDTAFLMANDLFVSINLPLDALLLPETLERIEARRAHSGLPAHHVLIELTESRPVYDFPTLKATLDRWWAIGYRIAIDDIGPDVVNQAVLFDMPFQTVKLDKKIVLRSRTDALAQRYLQRTVAKAKAHSLSVIAEGIEDRVMWDRMAALGVDQAQGFMIARGLPAAALPVWLDIWNQHLATLR